MEPLIYLYQKNNFFWQILILFHSDDIIKENEILLTLSSLTFYQF